MADLPDPQSAPALPSDLRALLDAALEDRRPGDAVLLARVKSRVLASLRSEAGSPHRTVRAGAGVWETLAPGVERKWLWDSGDAFSCLMRLAPGASVAGHSHPIDEECVVLEGSLRIGADLLLRAGDFHVGVQGAAHEAADTETGAVVYLRGARPRPELIE